MLFLLISVVCCSKVASEMNDGRPQRVGLSSNNKTPIDDIIEHITADLQSYEGQYILLGQPTSNSSSRTIWHQFNGSGNSQPTEPQNYRLNNFTYDNGRSNDLGMEPRMMYTENTFVDMSNSGFVPYLISPTNQYTTSHHDPHMNYLYYQRHSSSSVADEYGLFDTGNLGRREQSILQNLRTNWPSSNQEAYNNTSFNDMNVEPMDIDSSPQFYFREQQNNSQLFQAQQHQQSSNLQSQQCLLFQQSPQREQHGQRQPLFQQQHPLHQQEQSIFQQQQSLSQHSSSPVGNFQTVPKKPRMVAEVRPMRPTYSDVLAKSVTSTSSQTNGCITKSMKNAKLDVSRTMNNVVPKPKKASAGVKNGNVILKRQHSNGSSEEQLLNGSGKCNNVEKKSRSANGSIHWSSLEDLEQNSSNGDLNESSRQKSSFSSNTVNNKGKKNVRKQKINHQNSEHEYSSRKVINNDDRMHGRKSAKKSNSQITNNNSTQWETGKTATSSPLRTDKKQPNKAITVDSSSAKKATKSSGIIDGVENQKSSIVNNKNARFNISNTSIPKKSPRVVKRRASPSQFGLFWKRWCKKSEEYLLLFINWFVNLLWDVIAMSFRLFFHLLGVSMCCGLTWFRTSKSIFGKMYTNPWNWWKEVKNCKHPSGKKASNRADNAYSIPANIPLPATGEEAMKRLLACKGKDAYSILGVTKTCSDDVIKRYYKRQAVLVHPDKNNQPGAEEAFKILVHAFDLIGEPEKRKAYDRCSLETPQMDKVWGEFSSLLVQLHKKMEYAANTIRCTNCGQRHRRVKIERPLYAARFCSQCKIHHSSREGDIWAESLFMGWIWKYYACMDGAVYDISDWAACQSENLRHLKPNMHVVQYRIVVGKNRQSAYQPPAPPTNYSEPDLDDFLSSLYGQSTSGGAGGGNCNPANDLNSRIRKKSKKKTK